MKISSWMSSQSNHIKLNIVNDGDFGVFWSLFHRRIRTYLSTKTTFLLPFFQCPPWRILVRWSPPALPGCVQRRPHAAIPRWSAMWSPSKAPWFVPARMRGPDLAGNSSILHDWLMALTAWASTSDSRLPGCDPLEQPPSRYSFLHSFVPFLKQNCWMEDGPP